MFVLLNSKQVVEACHSAEVALTELLRTQAGLRRSAPQRGAATEIMSAAQLETKLRGLDRIRKVAVYGERVAKSEEVQVGLVEEELKLLNESLNHAHSKR